MQFKSVRYLSNKVLAYNLRVFLYNLKVYVITLKLKVRELHVFHEVLDLIVQSLKYVSTQFLNLVFKV
jgi:phosphatidylserine decarboxylase